VNITFGFLTGTDPYIATIPDSMSDGVEQRGVVVLNEVERTVQWSSNKNIPSDNGQVPKGTVHGQSGPVPVFGQAGNAPLDVDPLALPLLATSKKTGAGSATAAFVMSPNPAVVGQTVAFNGSTSSVSGGGSCLNPTMTLDWDLTGDGQIDAQGSTVTQVCGEAGAALVTLRVTSSCGPVDVKTQVLLVQPNPNAVDVDLPAVDFLYWTLPGGLIWSSADVSEATNALQTLASNIGPYEDFWSLPRVRLSGPLLPGNLQDAGARDLTVYYGVASPTSVTFAYAGSFAADNELIDDDSAFVTRGTALGITVTCAGSINDLASLRSQAASIASSMALLTL
jgi:hypothetical protein